MAGENRLLQPWTLREAALLLGVVGLVTAFALTPALTVLLFAPDGRELSQPVAAWLERARLLAAALAAIGLSIGLLRTRMTRRPLPVSRGAALLTLLCLAVTLILGEAALRVRGLRAWGSPLRTPLTQSTMCCGAGNTLRPGVYAAGVRDFFRPARRSVRFSINRYGLRGREPVLPKPAGLTRVVCVGGSTTFGYSVTDGEDWPARLEAELAGSPAIEVLNAGRPGATTASDFVYLRDRLLRLDPDVVILYEGFNDFWRAIQLRRDGQVQSGVVNEAALASEPSLSLEPPRPWPLRASFAAHHLGAWLETRLGSQETRRQLADSASGPGAVPAAEDVRNYGRNLRAMIRLCRDAGVRVVLATFAGCDDPALAPDERRRRTQYVLDDLPGLGVSDIERGFETYRDATRAVAREEAVPLVDLASGMPKDLALFTDTVHFTALGEERLAALLAEGLRPAASGSRAP